jgi:MinD-like ATPase involved in chromosome partitioning or flagellar assembly
MGRLVLGVYDPDESTEGKQRLLDLGVNDVIEARATPDEFLIAIRALAASVRVAPMTETVEPEITSTEPEGRRGRIVVVAGTAGGTGATEVAIALGARLASRTSTVIVDADDRAASVTQRLALGLHPNLRTAIDALEHGRADVDSTLVGLPGSGLRVLGGLPSRPAPSDVRSEGVINVIRKLAEAVHWVVTDAGGEFHDLGRSAEHSRRGLARALLGSADVVVGVADASPVGLARLLGWLADLRPVVDGSPVVLVINRAPRSLYQRSEITREVLAACDPHGLAFLPADRRVTAAAWAGEQVGRGPFTRSIAALAADVVTASAARARA